MDAKQKHDAKQARRKQNRALKRHGLEYLPLGAHTGTVSKLVKGPLIGALQRRAERDVRLRCTLLQTMQTGTPLERTAAAKAKRKLNDVWTNRKSSSLTGFWNPNA